MNWEALGAVGEIVGAVAVVVTLGYLAVQIRQNTRSVQAATHHSLGRSARDAEMLFAGNETAAHIFHTGTREPDRLTVEERVRFHGIMQSTFAWFEDVYFQHQQAMVTLEYWEARRRWMQAYLRQPGVFSWWGQNSRFYADSFVLEVGRLLQQDGAAGQQPAAPGRGQTGED
jgi:hypothetical protein